MVLSRCYGKMIHRCRKRILLLLVVAGLCFMARLEIVSYDSLMLENTPSNQAERKVSGVHDVMLENTPSNQAERKVSGVHDVMRATLSTGYCTKPIQHQHSIHCERLIIGDEAYMHSLKSLKLSRDSQNCKLNHYMRNCSNFKVSHGYMNKVVTDEELKFPLAFGIKVHTDPVFVEQLLRTIYRPHNVYCIHVDKKADKSVSDPLQRLGECFNNVIVIQEYRVVYSSIRQPLSDIACMKKLLDMKVKWKYYLILAGQEFPLKTNLEIVRICKILNGTNDIESYPFEKRIIDRIQFSHPIIKDTIVKVSNISKSAFKHNITLFKGSSYGLFSRGFVEFVLKNKLFHDFLMWSNDTYAPEEMLWSSINRQPGTPGGSRVDVKHANIDFISRAMLWFWDKPKCKGKYVRSVCVFSHKDLPYLVSAPEVIANKFNSDYDQLVVDCLEEWNRNKTALGKTVNVNWFYYRNAPHVRNTSYHF